MQLHLQSRGRTTDYTFLGAAPADTWWLDFQRYTRFEGPTIIVRRRANDAGWCAYLSGIPSSRRDSVERVIRYTIVGSGTGEESRPLAGLIAAWLADVARAESSVQRALDEAFDEDFVEHCLRPSADTQKEWHAAVDKRLHDLVRRLSAPTEAGANPSGASDHWCGGIEDPEVRSAFVARVAAILRGQPAVAVFLNEAEPSDLQRVVDHWQVPVALLLADSAAPLQRLEKKKLTPGVPRPRPRSSSASPLALLSLLAMAALLGWLIVRIL